MSLPFKFKLVSKVGEVNRFEISCMNVAVPSTGTYNQRLQLRNVALKVGDNRVWQKAYFPV